MSPHYGTTIPDLYIILAAMEHLIASPFLMKNCLAFPFPLIAHPIKRIIIWALYELLLL